MEARCIAGEQVLLDPPRDLHEIHQRGEAGAAWAQATRLGPRREVHLCHIPRIPYPLLVGYTQQLLGVFPERSFRQNFFPFLTARSGRRAQLYLPGAITAVPQETRRAGQHSSAEGRTLSGATGSEPNQWPGPTSPPVRVDRTEGHAQASESHRRQRILATALGARSFIKLRLERFQAVGLSYGVPVAPRQRSRRSHGTVRGLRPHLSKRAEKRSQRLRLNLREFGDLCGQIRAPYLRQ